MSLLQLFKKQSETTEKLYNPINYNAKCLLINNKKSSYYIHTYDPTIPLNILKNPDFNIDNKEIILDKFDDNIKQNCCNVISISLYFTNCSNETLEKYLYSIFMSIKNVEKNLPDWIVRLYLRGVFLYYIH